ncbi:MAG: hypothetical protein IPI84_14350 [Holophagaceae bacterium]|nr:hypothetical protein [Holophagaceae bacterium]
MRRQGYRVVRTEAVTGNAAPGVFQAFPYHWVITPTHSEIQDLLVRNRIAAVRYSTPFDFPGGVVSYHITLREPYSLDQLKAQARNGVKAGLSRFKIEQIPFERLATEGWVLQQDTLDRQDRLRSMTQTQWESFAARPRTGGLPRPGRPPRKESSLPPSSSPDCSPPFPFPGHVPPEIPGGA